MAQTYTKEKIDELLGDVLPEQASGDEGKYLKVGESSLEWAEAGTEVIANPTLAGTESALTGLQVGDTKYKIETGGDKLYAHRVWLRISYQASSNKFTGNGFVSYISRNPNASTTKAELLDALWDAGVTQASKVTPAFIVSLRESDVTSTQNYIKIFNTFMTLQMYSAQSGTCEIGYTQFDVSTTTLRYTTSSLQVSNSDLYFTVIGDYVSEL